MNHEEITHWLQEQLHRVNTDLAALNQTDTAYRRAEGKWSVKEELGHLIDSAVNNLKRFTEIVFETAPMQIVQYNPDGLVSANAYQEEDFMTLIDLWNCLNQRILAIWAVQKDTLDSTEIILPDGSRSDYRFLKKDYVAHMTHHLDVILRVVS